MGLAVPSGSSLQLAVFKLLMKLQSLLLRFVGRSLTKHLREALCYKLTQTQLLSWVLEISQ